MITIVNKEIVLSEKEAKTKAAFFSSDSIYSGDKLKFKVNKSTGKAFRLVHNGKDVFALIEGTDKSKTTTIYEVEEFKTEQEALTRISELGLKYENDNDTTLA